MAQQMQEQRTSQSSLEILRPVDSVPIELAPCVQLEAHRHIYEEMGSLEQEALASGADFVGK
jgi:hypothetical protein|tara:strand:- start:399 stop:584 length:186 start_codon:yes stop_codon:yes gene_type:complete